MNRQYYVYLHCRPDGVPFYVGKGHGRRSSDFKRGRNKHYTNVARKIGFDRIQVFVFHCASEQEALADEVQHIKQLRSEGVILTNITDGGEGVSGLVHSAETRKRLSEIGSGKTRFPCPDEVKRKIAAAQSGRLKGPNPEHSLRLKGRKLSDAHKAKIAQAHTGQKRSEQARANMSAAQRGHPVTEQARLNMSKAHLGKPPTELQRAAYSSAERSKKIGDAHRGKFVSPETRAKQSIAAKNRRTKPCSS